MNIKLEKKLKEYSEVAEDWLLGTDWLEKRYLYFKDFFKTENIKKAEWNKFQEMGENLHAFGTAIAKANALGKMNLKSIDEYRKIFLYMVSEKDPIDVTINNLYKKYKGSYSLPFFSDSTISELVAYAFPEKYIIYNKRDKIALEYLDMTMDAIRGEKFGGTFLRYNEIMKKVINAYKNIVGKRTNTSINLEVDQFFSWLCKNIEKEENNNSDIDYYCVGFNWKDEGGDRLKEFLSKGIWQNGYDKKYTQVVKKVKVGSKIAAKSSYTKKKGTATISILKIYAIGEVIENPKDGKNLKINWNEIYTPFELEGLGGYRSTIGKIGKKENIELIFEHDENINTFLDDLNNEDDIGLLNSKPLNKILYGPPGTGKTYHTINRAIEIIDPAFDLSQIRKKIKDKYDEYVKNEQIVFTTFHQSYGYEEFVEGIKAIPPGSEDNAGKEMIYKTVAGIFRKICKQACENYENSRKTKELQSKEKILKQKVDEFLSDSLENETEFTKTQKGKFKITQVGDSDITVETEDSKYSGNIVKLDKKEFLMVAENIDEKFKFSKEMAVKLFKVNSQRQKDTYYFNLGKEFKKFKSTLKEETVEVEKLKNFVLIIDEINRGNISKIFGELITLIEESKRLGNTEQLKVKLPYSGEEFGVPKNLYVIGTMNTADRSIALMDTALRRRFQFEEMMPKSEKVPEVINTKNGEIELRKLFETINERIEYLYDRDHTIGHSYFMDVKTKDDLDIVFKTNVIPLLQEYFYDDWEKIQIVLGDHFDQLMGNKTSSGNDVEKWKDDDEFYEKRFILSRKIVETLVIGFDHDEIEDDKKEYRINEKFSIEAYKKIYAERINE